jgi:Spy/CpxP family protein refolding chaperone
MERPKQQALAFLLGAVLVGGVLGFSADRVLRSDDTSLMARRKALYDHLDMQPAQRAAMDSLFDARNCKYDSIFTPIQPALDTLRLETRAKIDAILTAEQRVRLDVRRREDDARKDAERQRMLAACRS